MKALKNIVIVGAGYAGVLTAKKLAKRLKKQEDVQITVIDKNPAVWAKSSLPFCHATLPRRDTR